jgi:thiol-disulfide isomerase/thioredoxin
MFRKYFVIITTIFFLSVSINIVLGQKIEYLKIPELEKILSNKENRLYVVNFWATWCPPCVKELPYFQSAAKGYDPSKVKFILISLDFPSQIEKQLVPFLKKNKILLDVAVMTDLDYNSWIDKVDTDWQGNIPATLVFNNPLNIRYFHPGELNETELKGIINKYL